MQKKIKAVYFFPNDATFIHRDIDVLEEICRVKRFSLNQGSKVMLPFQLIKQFFQALYFIPQSKVVVCHFAGYASFIPNFLGRCLGKPRFLIIAGTDAASFPKINYGNYGRSKALDWATKKAIKNATHLLPVHERLAYQTYGFHPYGGEEQGFHHFYPPSKKIPFSPFYYSYDSNYFTINGHIERRKNSFISIGNLSVSTTFVRKGFDLIIELAEKRPDLSFTLIGWDGKKEINAPQNVRILPFMSQEAILKELNAHEYYFQLSLMEGFPNALVEAMLCGCIPIGSDVSGIPFIIGETGYVVDKHNVDILNNVVSTALSDGYSEQKGEQARERVVSTFNHESKRKAYQELLDKYVYK